MPFVRKLAPPHRHRRPKQLGSVAGLRIVVLLAVGGVGLLAGAPRAWFEAASEEGAAFRQEGLAVFQTQRGDWQPVLWPLDRNPESAWRELTYSEHRGLKIHLAVSQVTTSSRLKRVFPVSDAELTGLLIDGLRRTGRFVVERRREDGSAPVPAEAYRVAAHLSADLGEDATDLEAVVLAVRLVDSSTEQVRLGFEGRALPRNAVARRSQGARRSLTNLDGEGQPRRAVESAVNKGVFRLARWFERHPWQSVVCAVDPDGVWVGAGSDHGLEVGVILRLLAPGEAVIDPEGGQTVGSITRPVGRLRVIETEPRRARVEVLEGRRGLKTGYRVELEPRPHFGAG